MRIRELLIVGLLAGFLAACAGDTIPDPEAQSNVPATDDSMSSQDAMTDRGMGEGEFFEDEAPMTMIIYFDFDKSDLRPEYADLLARHAAQLSNSSRTMVRLEGHADERGSREYNIGLGESSDQISTVSFGEERPVAFGSDEASYQQNRRVEIKYLN
jgi:peptidoglycan-associated lipoprotein